MITTADMETVRKFTLFYEWQVSPDGLLGLWKRVRESIDDERCEVGAVYLQSTRRWSCDIALDRQMFEDLEAAPADSDRQRAIATAALTDVAEHARRDSEWLEPGPRLCPQQYPDSVDRNTAMSEWDEEGEDSVLASVITRDGDDRPITFEVLHEPACAQRLIALVRKTVSRRDRAGTEVASVQIARPTASTRRLVPLDPRQVNALVELVGAGDEERASAAAERAIQQRERTRAGRRLPSYASRLKLRTARPTFGPDPVESAPSADRRRPRRDSRCRTAAD